LCLSSAAVIIGATWPPTFVGGLIVTMNRLIPSLRSHTLFTLILGGYFALAFGFSVANPIY
jgi:hypothetical protein